MRICLKYGIDPNAPGIHPNTVNITPNSQTPTSNSYSHSSARLSPDLPRASPCRNGTLDYNGYYTNERLFTLPPLFLAAQRNNHYACTLLLKYGANINVRDEQYCSPLHLAARLQHDVCNILISHHACITISNKYGDTPLSLWSNVKQLQSAFVEREFSKLCRKHSSISKRYRFLTRDNNNEQYQTTSSMLNCNNTNNSNNGLVPAHGLRNLKRVFRYSGSDSYDSKSFKKSLSSQSSIGKSKRLASCNLQTHGQGTSMARSESRQVSEEPDEVDVPHFRRSFRIKRKVSYSITKIYS
jgi:ankyrin repeat protein